MLRWFVQVWIRGGEDLHLLLSLSLLLLILIYLFERKAWSHVLLVGVCLRARYWVLRIDFIYLHLAHRLLLLYGVAALQQLRIWEFVELVRWNLGAGRDQVLFREHADVVHSLSRGMRRAEAGELSAILIEMIVVAAFLISWDYSW